MKAYTQKNEGETSAPVIAKTDIAGPSAPLILNLTCAAEDSIYLRWARPREFFNSIDFYFINYISDHSNDNITLDTSTKYFETEVRDSSKILIGL